MDEQELLESFARDGSGRWTSLRPFNLDSPDAKSIEGEAGLTFAPGELHQGVDLAELLDSIVASRVS